MQKPDDRRWRRPRALAKTVLVGGCLMLAVGTADAASPFHGSMDEHLAMAACPAGTSATLACATVTGTGTLSHLGELARHSLTPRVVYDVWAESPRYRRNRRRRAASHLMIGPDRGGILWVVCIVERPWQPGLWRAITGWRAEDEDEAWYRRST